MHRRSPRYSRIGAWGSRRAALLTAAIFAAVTMAASPAHADMTLPTSTPLTPPASEEITLHVNTLTGNMYFTGVPDANMSFYQISSASASLNDAAWNSFQDQSILNPDATITSAQPGEIVDWMEMAHNNSLLQDMSCANMMSSMNGLPVIFDSAARSYDIGAAFQTAGSQDLQFIFNVDLDYTPDYIGAVVYEPAAAPEPASLALAGAGALLFLPPGRRRRPAT